LHFVEVKQDVQSGIEELQLLHVKFRGLAILFPEGSLVQSTMHLVKSDFK